MSDIPRPDWTKAKRVWVSDHLFFSIMAIATATTIAGGFSRTGIDALTQTVMRDWRLPRAGLARALPTFGPADVASAIRIKNVL